ncbi:hypothetical protein [Anaerobutyricum soehngenii]|uniref:hypothetical protein n=1 Tax=Anaerobutyricum soehngenii TaxID=105843 RepID=UPI001ADD724A|nr:hypothetical protein [Anaerobutyricum soehngenii]
MLIRILNTLPSASGIWYFFFFLTMLNPQLVRMGILQKVMYYRGATVHLWLENAVVQHFLFAFVCFLK